MLVLSAISVSSKEKRVSVPQTVLRVWRQEAGIGKAADSKLALWQCSEASLPCLLNWVMLELAPFHMAHGTLASLKHSREVS